MRLQNCDWQSLAICDCDGVGHNRHGCLFVLYFVGQARARCSDPAGHVEESNPAPAQKVKKRVFFGGSPKAPGQPPRKSQKRVFVATPPAWYKCQNSRNAQKSLIGQGRTCECCSYPFATHPLKSARIKESAKGVFGPPA